MHTFKRKFRIAVGSFWNGNTYLSNSEKSFKVSEIWHGHLLIRFKGWISQKDTRREGVFLQSSMEGKDTPSKDPKEKRQIGRKSL